MGNGRKGVAQRFLIVANRTGVVGCECPEPPIARQLSSSDGTNHAISRIQELLGARVKVSFRRQ